MLLVFYVIMTELQFYKLHWSSKLFVYIRLFYTVQYTPCPKKGNLALFPAAKEFWKLVKIWQFNRKSSAAYNLLGHGVLCSVLFNTYFNVINNKYAAGILHNACAIIIK